MCLPELIYRDMHNRPMNCFRRVYFLAIQIPQTHTVYAGVQSHGSPAQTPQGCQRVVSPSLHMAKR